MEIWINSIANDRVLARISTKYIIYFFGKREIESKFFRCLLLLWANIKLNSYELEKLGWKSLSL